MGTSGIDRIPPVHVRANTSSHLSASSITRGSLALVAGLLALSACTPLGRDTPAPEPSLVGAWMAEVSLLDCLTNQPLGAPAFRAIVVFHEGGTLSETSGPSVLRTPSFGTWTQSAPSEYVAVSSFLTYDATGASTGTQEIRRTIRLSDDGRHFVAETRSVGADAGGTVTSQTCARGDAERIE